jgi:hypothetical protein
MNEVRLAQSRAYEPGVSTALQREPFWLHVNGRHPEAEAAMRAYLLASIQKIMSPHAVFSYRIFKYFG